MEDISIAYIGGGSEESNNRNKDIRASRCQGSLEIRACKDTERGPLEGEKLFRTMLYNTRKYLPDGWGIGE